jgi:hypothetical protein
LISPVGTLAVSETTPWSATLAWTATGDDGGTGRATSYDVRYASTPITEATWAAAARAVGEPAPRAVAQHVLQRDGLSVDVGARPEPGPAVAHALGPDPSGEPHVVARRRARGQALAQRLEGPGFFYPATVLSNVPDDAKMLNEEIFGPVASIQTFKSEDEAIKRANDTEYGLVAYLYTKDLSRGMRVSEKLDFGMIGLNRGLVSDPAAPFGGTKQSGLGREGAHEGLMEFMETQYISVSW